MSPCQLSYFRIFSPTFNSRLTRLIWLLKWCRRPSTKIMIIIILLFYGSSIAYSVVFYDTWLLCKLSKDQGRFTDTFSYWHTKQRNFIVLQLRGKSVPLCLVSRANDTRFIRTCFVQVWIAHVRRISSRLNNWNRKIPCLTQIASFPLNQGPVVSESWSLQTPLKRKLSCVGHCRIWKYVG